jgi:hypothetical protein
LKKHAPAHVQHKVTRMTYQFRDVRFLSAKEKAAILRGWVRFLKSGLRFACFSDRLYQHLIQHCSFIAHFNRLGFYECYFVTGARIARFLSQFDARGECQSIEMGGRYWLSGDYDDINRAMIAEAEAYIPRLIEEAQARQREADLATAKALLAKHGVSHESL